MNHPEKKIKLTQAQAEILKVARDHGHAFAKTTDRQRAGGARERMVLRLRAKGLLSWSRPHTITEAGRVALDESTADPA